MADSFFFYDLETSGLNASSARIMQFAGQRTNAQLEPVGEPVNVLIKLAPDVIPSPEAIMLTGITPQSTLLEGLTEAEFLRFFYEEVVQPNTTFLGYNTVRFDDEFMRYLHYRNFYDPYEWQWQNGCSRWDILDLVRMTRALRPEGIEWPVTDEGKPTNRLELLTTANGLNHDHAHDALSDVTATIAVAKLIRDKQPDLFKFMLNQRNKKVVSGLVQQGQPFVYASGRYPGENEHTTVAVLLAPHPQQDCGLVYDLRYDPTPFIAMTPEQLVDAWRYKKDRDETELRLPVKTLKYNRCPAVAPLGVLKDDFTQERIHLSLATVSKHLAILKANQLTLAKNVIAAVKILDAERELSYAQPGQPTSENVDGLLYNGFFAPGDKQLMSAVRAAAPDDIADLAAKLSDARLRQMAPLYKARNFPQSLTLEERQAWEEHLAAQLLGNGSGGGLAAFFAKLQELAAGKLTSQQEYIIEELQLYGESIMPSDISEQ